MVDDRAGVETYVTSDRQKGPTRDSDLLFVEHSRSSNSSLLFLESPSNRDSTEADLSVAPPEQRTNGFRDGGGMCSGATFNTISRESGSSSGFLDDCGNRLDVSDESREPGIDKYDDEGDTDDGDNEMCGIIGSNTAKASQDNQTFNQNPEEDGGGDTTYTGTLPACQLGILHSGFSIGNNDAHDPNRKRGNDSDGQCTTGKTQNSTACAASTNELFFNSNRNRHLHHVRAWVGSDHSVPSHGCAPPETLVADSCINDAGRVNSSLDQRNHQHHPSNYPRKHRMDCWSAASKAQARFPNLRIRADHEISSNGQPTPDSSARSTNDNWFQDVVRTVESGPFLAHIGKDGGNKNTTHTITTSSHGSLTGITIINAVSIVNHNPAEIKDGCTGLGNKFETKIHQQVKPNNDYRCPISVGTTTFDISAAPRRPSTSAAVSKTDRSTSSFSPFSNRDDFCNGSGGVGLKLGLINDQNQVIKRYPPHNDRENVRYTVFNPLPANSVLSRCNLESDSSQRLLPMSISPSDRDKLAGQSAQTMMNYHQDKDHSGQQRNVIHNIAHGHIGADSQCSTPMFSSLDDERHRHHVANDRSSESMHMYGTNTVGRIQDNEQDDCPVARSGNQHYQCALAGMDRHLGQSAMKHIASNTINRALVVFPTHEHDVSNYTTNGSNCSSALNLQPNYRDWSQNPHKYDDCRVSRSTRESVVLNETENVISGDRRGSQYNISPHTEVHNNDLLDFTGHLGGIKKQSTNNSHTASFQAASIGDIFQRPNQNHPQQDRPRHEDQHQHHHHQEHYAMKPTKVMKTLVTDNNQHNDVSNFSCLAGDSLPCHMNTVNNNNNINSNHHDDYRYLNSSRHPLHPSQLDQHNCVQTVPRNNNLGMGDQFAISHGNSFQIISSTQVMDSNDNTVLRNPLNKSRFHIKQEPHIGGHMTRQFINNMQQSQTDISNSLDSIAGCCRQVCTNDGQGNEGHLGKRRSEVLPRRESELIMGLECQPISALISNEVRGGGGRGGDENRGLEKDSCNREDASASMPFRNLSMSELVSSKNITPASLSTVINSNSIQRVVNEHHQVVNEQHKVERKRERNRIAARKCRTRKLEHISELEGKVMELKSQNDELAKSAVSLQFEILQMKQILLDHNKKGCPNLCLAAIDRQCSGESR